MRIHKSFFHLWHVEWAILALETNPTRAGNSAVLQRTKPRNNYTLRAAAVVAAALRVSRVIVHHRSHHRAPIACKAWALATNCPKHRRFPCQTIKNSRLTFD
jgi:hypothetical protein